MKQNYLKSVLLSVMLCIASIMSYAQAVNDVTLTVSADGASKAEATKNALRSAIEQAYGTFVSANTTILNDELVKDEIVTITNGNIKSYEEISSTAMPDGSQFVTLKATVSISNLISYAQSKGAETEFAGATFGMNMKMLELNKKNELIVLNNLVGQIRHFLPYAFDIKVSVSDPIVTNADDFLSQSVYLYGYDSEDLDRLAHSFSYYMLPDDDTQYHDKEFEEEFKNWILSANNSYQMGINIEYVQNQNTASLKQMITSTLQSIFLTNEQKKELYKYNLQPTRIEIYMDPLNIRLSWCYLRNSKEDLTNWLMDMSNVFNQYFRDFEILDNTGVSSTFSANFDQKTFKDARSEPIWSMPYDAKSDAMVKGTGLLSPFSVYSYAGCGIECPGKNADPNDRLALFMSSPYINITFLINKDDIYKYSNFKVINKQSN